MGLEDKFWNGSATYNPAGSASLSRTYEDERLPGGSVFRTSNVKVTANNGYKITDIEYDEVDEEWFQGSQKTSRTSHKHLTYASLAEVSLTLDHEKTFLSSEGWAAEDLVTYYCNVKVTCTGGKPPVVGYFVYTHTTIEPDAARLDGCTASYTDRTRLWTGAYPTSDITVTRSAVGTAKWRFSHWEIGELHDKFYRNPQTLTYSSLDFRKQSDGSYVCDLDAIAVFERVYTGELLYGDGGSIIYGSAGKLVYSG